MNIEGHILTSLFVDIPNKLSGVKESIFSVMSSMAKAHDALNLSQGFPEFDPPKQLLEEVNWAMNNGYNQYAPMPGYIELREQIAQKELELHGHDVHSSDEITVTPGATVALFACIHAIVEPGDEVILLDPAYDSYQAAVEWAGGKCVRIPMNLKDLSFPTEQINDKLNPRTKLIIITTPHNPLGAVMTDEDWKALTQITEPIGTFILSDEVYEHMVFDQKKHKSVLQVEGLKERSMKVSSFGKTFHSTGWKMGYVIANNKITEMIRRLYQFVNFSTHSATQMGLTRFMSTNPNWERELSTFYEKKRNLFQESLVGSKWKIYPCSGSYFQILGFDAFSQKADDEFASILTQQHGIASIPINVFNENASRTGLLRFCFAKSDETLIAAVNKLKQIPTL